MTPKRIKCVLVLPEFYGTENTSIQTLEDNGFDVVPVIRRIGFKNPLLLLKSKMGFDMTREQEKYYIKLSAEIEKICNIEKPDVLFVTQGLQVLPDSVDRLRQHCITILSLSDRISEFPQLLERVSHYDIVYTYSKEEIELLKRMGVNASYSYMGYDDTIYFPIEIDKDIDICFVGTMYKERREILELVARDFSNYKIAFYGKYASPLHIREYIRWMRERSIHCAFMNRNLNSTEVNKLYNRSKICLNITRKNMSKEWTPRIVEIMGSKGFQIVERNNLIENDFPGCVCMYDGYDELKQSIIHYLEYDEDRSAIAERGYIFAKENYTLRMRKKIRYDNCKESIYALQREKPRSFDL